MFFFTFADEKKRLSTSVLKKTKGVTKPALEKKHLKSFLKSYLDCGIISNSSPPAVQNRYTVTGFIVTYNFSSLELKIIVSYKNT